MSRKACYPLWKNTWWIPISRLDTQHFHDNSKQHTATLTNCTGNIQLLMRMRVLAPRIVHVRSDHVAPTAVQKNLQAPSPAARFDPRLLQAPEACFAARDSVGRPSCSTSHRHPTPNLQSSDTPTCAVYVWSWCLLVTPPWCRRCCGC